MLYKRYEPAYFPSPQGYKLRAGGVLVQIDAAMSDTSNWTRKEITEVEDDIRRNISHSR